MDTEQSPSRDPVAAPNHIIERPRLIKLMEESGARVIVLHAPAGYGKTTLARQWVGQPDRRCAWYRCSSSSADVAALARSLAETIEIAPRGLAERMAQRIAATSSPEADAGVLAEMFVAQSPRWEDDLWLVLDDYQALIGSQAAESFVQGVVEGLGARVVVTTRARPAWIHPRQIVYGEVLELDRTLLAMTDEEAQITLASGNNRDASLIKYARGWPAVIGLAAVVPSSRYPAAVPPTLLEFLADELLQGLDEEVQAALVQLSLSPTGSRKDAQAILGREAESLLDPAAAAGFFSPSAPDADELHPLLRAFLRTKLQLSATGLEDAAQTLVDFYLSQSRWDDAFTVADEARSPQLSLAILDRAFEPLMAAGRVATLSRWLQPLESYEPARPLYDLATAELAFREGLHEKAQRLAIEASRGLNDSDPRRAQAFIRAGQAAAQANDVVLARELFSHAKEVASTPRDSREALLGDLFAALELESADLTELVNSVVALSADDLDADIRLQSALLIVSLRTGGLLGTVSRAEPYQDLITRVKDPFARAAFTNALAHACNATARYTAGLALTRAQAAFAANYRLNFAVPHTLHAEAIALLGLRRLRRASRSVDELAERAATSEDVHFQLNAVVLRARHLLLSMNPEAAAELLVDPPERRASAGLRAEYLATRALSLLAMERYKNAASSAAEAGEATSWLAESAVIAGFVRAACSASDRRSESAASLLELVATTGHLDAFVLAFRAAPTHAQRLDPVLDRARMERIFARAEAPDISTSVPMKLGLTVTADVLSKREHDVYALLCRGMSNREIAQHLFLSEKTVKVHLRHIYDKLGVKTRTQAALLRRSVLKHR